MVCHGQPEQEFEESGLISVGEALQCGTDDAFVMLSNSYLYCDAAGGVDHGFIVVAGYVSTFAAWSAYTSQWNLLLATFNVSHFHMKEFSQSTGPFASWRDDEPKRIRFLSRAAMILKEHLQYGVASFVDYAAFDKVNKIYPLDAAVGNPYSLAGRTCVAHAAKHFPGKAIHSVFEDGDKGKGELLRILERDQHQSPIFRPSRDQKNKRGEVLRGVVPLQAADFAAYELRKVYKDDPKEEWPLWKYRKSLRALSAIPSYWAKYSESDLIETCKNASLPLRNQLIS